MLLLQSLIAYACANAFFWLGWFLARLGSRHATRRLRVCEALLERLVMMDDQEPEDMVPAPRPGSRTLYVVPTADEEGPTCGTN